MVITSRLLLRVANVCLEPAAPPLLRVNLSSRPAGVYNPQVFGFATWEARIRDKTPYKRATGKAAVTGIHVGRREQNRYTLRSIQMVWFTLLGRSRWG